MGHFFWVSFGQSFQLAWFTVHRASQVVPVVKNVPANPGDVRDMVSIPGKIPWRRKCNTLQYSCLENPMDRGAIVHRFSKSQKRLHAQSILGMSQDPFICVFASLSQDGFYQKGLWVGNIPCQNSPSASKEPFLHMCGRGGLLTSRKEIHGLGRAEPTPLIAPLFSPWSFIQ